MSFRKELLKCYFSIFAKVSKEMKTIELLKWLVSKLGKAFAKNCDAAYEVICKE